MTPMIVIDAVTVYVVASIFLIVLDQYNKKKPKYWHIVIDKYTDRSRYISYRDRSLLLFL